MKVKLLLIGTVLALAACKDKPAATETKSSDKKYPYTVTDYGWKMNDNDQNAITVLNALKAFENADTAALKPLVADSIGVFADGNDFDGTRAQFLQGISQEMSKYKSLRISVQDWHSVISKDKNQEWVSVWYTQYWEDTDGQPDSLDIFNDVSLKDGKITRWNEYVRHYSKP